MSFLEMWFYDMVHLDNTHKILNIIDWREKEIEFSIYELTRYFIIHVIDRYESDGKYLVSGSDDGHVIVVDGRASVNFKPVGYTSESHVPAIWYQTVGPFGISMIYMQPWNYITTINIELFRKF